MRNATLTKVQTIMQWLPIPIIIYCRLLPTKAKEKDKRGGIVEGSKL